MVSSMSKKVMENVDFPSTSLPSPSLPSPWERGGGNHRSTVCSSVSRCYLLIRPVWKLVS